MSRQRLERIASFIQGHVEEGRLAGAAAMVIRRGRVAYFHASGYAEKESRRPLQRDSIFRIYSMTKPVTGVALMTLQEEGALRLDDPVSRHIPEFKSLQVAAGVEGGAFKLEVPLREMTIRDLMTHTSGLTYGHFGESPGEAPDVDALYDRLKVLDPAGTLDDMIDKLSRIPLLHQPGSRWHYSVSVDVQGYLIEKLSGQRLDAFFEERIFGPLKMVDTGFHVPASKLDRLTASYIAPQQEEESIRRIDDPSHSELAQRPRFLSGGAGLVSTVSDYARFCQMLLNGGELESVRILKPETVALMTRNHLPASIGESGPESGVGFGLDFAVVTEASAAGGHVSKGTYYWEGLASTLFWIDPEERLIALFMAQLIPNDRYPLRSEFRRLTYQAIER